VSYCNRGKRFQIAGALSNAIENKMANAHRARSRIGIRILPQKLLIVGA
jgi:hypothetical protein